MKATDWKAINKNTLVGIFTLNLPSGLLIKECMLHEKEGKQWVGLPAKPWSKPDGSKGWTPFLAFVDDATKNKFMDLALRAAQEVANA